MKHVWQPQSRSTDALARMTRRGVYLFWFAGCGLQPPKSTGEDRRPELEGSEDEASGSDPVGGAGASGQGDGGAHEVTASAGGTGSGGAAEGGEDTEGIDITSGSDAGMEGDDGQTSKESEGDTDTTGDDSDGDLCEQALGSELRGVVFDGRPTTWRGGALGAYTIFHHRTCVEAHSTHFDVAGPELAARGLVGTFGLVAAGCGGWSFDMNVGDGGAWVQKGDDLWDEVEALVAAGHAMVSHGLYVGEHDGDLEADVLMATEILREGTGEPIDFWVPREANDSAAILPLLRDNGYLGARAGRRGGINAIGEFDPFAVDFDVHATPTGVGANPHQLIDLSGYIEQAQRTGGYAFREFGPVVKELNHDGGQAEWQILEHEYFEHLDEVHALAEAGKLWVAGPSEVLRYYFGRAHCPEARWQDGAIHFDPPSAECLDWVETLSYELSTSEDILEIGGRQGDQCVEVEARGPGSFIVRLDPTAGSAEIWAR